MAQKEGALFLLASKSAKIQDYVCWFGRNGLAKPGIVFPLLTHKVILLSNWRAFALREGLSTVTVDKVCVGSTIRELLEFIIILLSDSSWFVLLGQ